MSIQSTLSSSPIDVSSDVHSPYQITISSDLTPAHVSDGSSRTPAPHLDSIVTDRSIYLGTPTSLGSRLVSPASGSGLPSVHRARVSHPANPLHPTRSSHTTASAHYFELELQELHQQIEALQTENGELRGRCEVLQTENCELRGRVEALKYVFIWLPHESH